MMKTPRFLLLCVFLCLFFSYNSFAQIRNKSFNHPSKEINWLKSQLNKTNDPRKRAELNHGISDVYTEWGKSNPAIKYLKISVAEAQNGNMYKMQYQKKTSLAKLYARTGDYASAKNEMDIVFKNSTNDVDREKARKLLLGYADIMGIEDVDLMIKKREVELDEIESNKNALASKQNELIDRIDEKVKELQDAENASLLDRMLIEVEILKDSLSKNKKEYDSLKFELISRRATLEEAYRVKDRKTEFIANKYKTQNKFFKYLIIALCLILPVFVYSYFSIKKQKRLLTVQKAEIQEQSIELQTQNEELETTLDYLKKTQRQLLKKEQMASLGQLMAGIAHEINTPLGAIKSSIETVLDASEKNRINLPELVKKLTDDDFRLLMGLLNEGLENIDHYTAREERAIKRELRDRLKELGFYKTYNLADNLADIGVHTISDKYVPLLKNKHVDLIMKTAYDANIQIKNGIIIKRAVNRASRIIFALKYYCFTSKNEEMVLSDVVKSIQSVLTLYHNQLKHKIKVEKEFEELPQILCFPEELSQVWINLISNSVHAIEEHGTIKISAIKIGDAIEVSFADDGPGIPENIKDRIFDPFFTTKPAGQGTGLGLDIIKKIVDKHDGDISFNSNNDKGTTFRILLPIK